MAIIRRIDGVDTDATVEETLVALAAKGMVRLPVEPARLGPLRPLSIGGKAASAIIIEERR